MPTRPSSPKHPARYLAVLALLAVVAAFLALPHAAESAAPPCFGPYALSAHEGGGVVRVEWRGDGCRGRLEIGGDVAWDERMLPVRLAPGAFVRGEEKVGRTVRRLSLRAGDGGMAVASWSVDGEEAAFDGEARAWLAESALLLARQTGYRVGPRVAHLLASGGTAALVAELAAIDNDRVEALYAETVLGAEGLDGRERAALLAAASRYVASDAELADLLAGVAERGGDLPAVATAVRTVGSDADLARVLAAGFAIATASADRAALLAAAVGVGSDGDLSRLLIGAVERFDLADPSERRAFATAVATLGSDADHARVLAALSARRDLPPAALVMLLGSAAGIGSDGDLSRLLATVAEHHRLTGDPRRAYLRTAAGIGSEADRRRAEGAL